MITVKDLKQLLETLEANGLTDDSIISALVKPDPRPGVPNEAYVVCGMGVGKMENGKRTLFFSIIPISTLPRTEIN